ncbi:Lysine-arginine-ornithine-binding periplasmic protein precursor [Arthrobacter saudimassiliensis]|uniref:Lysine-arginine-ornithine-binding periplasmic protein n=1 Tax=Arthrobacter saudimassiliensis TaxID=1461584 RepID=A0A078MTU8_9MICC|nr:Lysine-arginine-ornithine-binding periplasmic protein precursor [Arthrobacter saudimassiliensis]
MNRRRLSAALGASALAFALVSCSSAEATTEGSLPGLTEAGKLTVCSSDSNYAPMYSMQDGEFTGVEPSLTEALAERLGLEASFTRMAFAGVIPAIQSDRCDLAMGAFFLTPERLATMKGLPYLAANVALIFPEGNSYAEPEDLAGKTVAVQRGSVQASTVEAVSADLEAAGEEPITVQSYDDPVTAINAVMNGKADAAGETEIFASNFFSEERAGLDFEPTFFPTGSVTGFLYKNGELEDALTAAMDELRTDGTLAGILEEFNLSPESISDGK